MYSFGYKYANFPFIAGFVKEKIGEGIFQAKKNLSIAVLQIKVARKTYDAIKEFLKEMYEKKEQYKYNYVGLIFATFHCFFKHKNWFYCSEFVRDLLVKFNVIKLDLKKIVKPMDFLDLENVKVIFDGLQNDYGRICCAA